MGKCRTATLLSVLLGALALSACHDGAYYAGVSVGPPAPLVYGPVGAAPGPGFAWVDGYYDWAGGRWFWTPGRWVRPPHAGYVWRRPYYERYHNGYRVHRGRWARH